MMMMNIEQIKNNTNYNYNENIKTVNIDCFVYRLTEFIFGNSLASHYLAK